MSMEALFLKVLNMSITASYVLLAVLLIRHLLKKAPKRYAYLLWSVVAFRLCIPVSFSSVFSLFRAKPFDMTAAQSGGGAALRYLTPDIGMAQAPQVTVGIPAMNAYISERLPQGQMAASANPLQLWITIGSMLWLAGLVALLLYSLISYARLRRLVAPAVRLEGRVYEADGIRSPFILGLVQPRIYLPFGLGETERDYVLRHEAYHLRRKDHLIQVIGWLILAVHWFNPLVWLAYTLMIRDMEMSCDEQVLGAADADIAKGYGLSLLAFATNRRIPLAGPLAFGETSIQERVKNIMSFRKPKKWVVWLTSLLCVAVIVACAANPPALAKSRTVEQIYGKYAFQETVYMNPLSSAYVGSSLNEFYTFKEDQLVIVNPGVQQLNIAIRYDGEKVDEQSFKKSFLITEGSPDISGYSYRYMYQLNQASDDTPAYRLYVMDDELWLAKLHGESIWSIYRLTPSERDGMGEGAIGGSSSPNPLPAPAVGSADGVEDFKQLNRDFKSLYDGDTPFNITPAAVKENSPYTIFKYDLSTASFLLYEDQIYPLGQWFGGSGVNSLGTADLDKDGLPELYFTYSWGSGLNHVHAAYFNPVTKEVVELIEPRTSGNLMFANTPDGDLALYTAKSLRATSSGSFGLEPEELVGPVSYEDGQIKLAGVNP